MNLKIKLLLPLLLSPLVGAQANEATLRMNCTSVQVSTATTKQSGVTYTLGFTTADDDVNGEWNTSDGTINYGTTVLFDAPNLGGTLVGGFYLEIPDTGDTDGDLVNDFFQVSKAVDGAFTSGRMFFDNGEDTAMGFVDVTWNRAAEATTGTVTLRVNLLRDLFLPVMTFTHTFEIYQYEGKLTYTVKGPDVDASVNLSRKGKAGQFTGPFPMGRRSHDVLQRPDTDWFGPGGESYTVLASDALDGDELLLTRGGAGNSYQGTFYFFDGVPSTAFLDEYDRWNLAIIDPNDADGNHIPDLTDGTEFVQPAGPVAKLTVSGGQFSLNVSAKAGQQVTIEQSTDLTGTAWEEVETRTLSSDVEDVPLGSPSEDARFYRVRKL